MYVVCHNDTTRTGISSEISVLDRSLELERYIETGASCEHNVINGSGEVYFCNSANDEYCSLNKVLFRYPVYIRGLARTENSWFIGGSDFSTKVGRNLTTGYVFRLDNRFNKVGSIQIPQIGSVYEIRAVNRGDRGSSEYARQVRPVGESVSGSTL